MDKQQAVPTAAEALKEAHDTIKWMWDNMSVDNKDLQNDAHDRPANTLRVIELAQEVWQYPSDAVEFAEWIKENGFEYNNDGNWERPSQSHAWFTTYKLYKLFNPSGAAPQPDPKCECCQGKGFLAVKEKQTDWTYRMDCPYCEARNDAMEETLSQRPVAPAAGPVWVNTVDRNPPAYYKGELRYIKHSEDGPWYSQWLDESKNV